MTLNTNPAEKNTGWTPSPPRVFKINVDGATSEDGRNSSVGVVNRDSGGVVLAACSKFLQGQFSVEEVEALTMEARILLARDMKLSQIIVESDAISMLIVLMRILWKGILWKGALAICFKASLPC